jgi:hypothetical protein
MRTTIRMPTLGNLYQPYSQGANKARKSFPSWAKRAAEEKARMKNGYKCAICKKVYADRNLFDIGHLNGKKWDNSPENCGLLCRSCNVKQGRKSAVQYKKLVARVGRNADVRKRASIKTKKRAKPRKIRNNSVFGSMYDAPVFRPPRLF